MERANRFALWFDATCRVEGKRRRVAALQLAKKMHPAAIQIIGNELAIKWDDGGESFIALEKLRRACPCAGCKGETDIMGNVYKIEKVERGKAENLLPAAFELRRIVSVGGYAIQPVWADGHATGIYSFDYLRRIAEIKN